MSRTTRIVLTYAVVLAIGFCIAQLTHPVVLHIDSRYCSIISDRNSCVAVKCVVDGRKYIIHYPNCSKNPHDVPRPQEDEW